MMVKVTIDREECISCEACWLLCPEFFEQNPEDEKSQVVEEFRTGGDPAEGDAPEGSEACVREAADECPVTVIFVED
ncbi:ferredoxin [Methanoculleus frigidifontis]|nr:ferredoxin [Methanoculleus sp. FWC-SCC1]